jgi:DNA polymerase-3 subunit alpha (Gram-positive type)
LVRISGFSHGTDVWVNNAQDLIREKTASLSEAISARDDIMVTLIQQGVKPKAAFDIMESVRKGKGIKEPGVVMLRENSVPEWFIGSCQKIQYMFPKAHAVAYVMMAVRIAWFKVHQPLAFYASYFTIRAEDFDPVAGAQGQKALEEVIAAIETKGNEATAKEKAKLLVIETAREMVLRGFSFQPVNLLESSADEFIIGDNSLLPPLAALPGLGAAAAQNIVQARRSKVFTSVEDLRVRSHISKSVIDILDSSGCLSELPVSDQLRLFA